MSAKRAIPKVAVAALTLGGAAGCGDDGNGGGGGVEDQARDFCESFVSCYGGGSVDACASDYLPSYITDDCRNALQAFFACVDDNFECGDPASLQPCGDEAEATQEPCQVTDGG